MERLNKYLARAGVASRRKADEIILSGSVKINGKVVTKLGTLVNPAQDKIEYQDQILHSAAQIIFMFNKPRGVTSTMVDQHAAHTIADYFRKEGRVFPVGRLDKDSEGLLLITNNGDLANKLMHPRYAHEKEYEVVIQYHSRHSGESLGRLQNRINKSIRSWTHPSPRLRRANASQDDEKGSEVEDDIRKKFSQRFVLDGYKIKPMQVKIIKKISSTRWLISLILQEGRKRQIRRVAEILGYKVVRLKRVRVGKLKLGRLPIGKYTRVLEKDII